MESPIFHDVSAAQLAAAIPAQEYNRLLSMPRTKELEGELLDRATWARAWFSQHGRPFVASRRVAIREISDSTILLETGHEFRSTVLAARLRKAEAHAVVALAVTAGKEVADEVSRCWAERPDEAFFLDRFAVAVTERLVHSTSAYLCQSSLPASETLLPHLSPGCGQWDFADQPRLMSVLVGTEVTGGASLGPLTLLSSGALHPQHSILAVSGVSHRTMIVTPDYMCRSCNYTPCTFRRAPYVHEG